jgi:hypothetical protein
VYTSNQTDSDVTVTLERGDCTKKGGTFVNGTIDANSFKYNGNSLDFGYTDPSGAAGAFSKSLAMPTREELGLLALREAGSRASRDLSTSAIIMGGLAAGMASLHAAPVAIEAFSAWRAAQLAAALKAAQQAWKAMPEEQRRAAMDWLSKIKPGGPPPGPLPPGASVEALQAYRDIAVKIIQSGKDGVGTQALRVDAINKALRGK